LLRSALLRSAQPDDHAAIVAVTDAAFEGSEEALRVVRELEPEISLVYEDDGAIVGHVMLTRMELDEHRPFQLSPLSVAPSHQNRGIGSASRPASSWAPKPPSEAGSEEGGDRRGGCCSVSSRRRFNGHAVLPHPAFRHRSPLGPGPCRRVTGASTSSGARSVGR
jgi:hypothetical protein